MRRRLAALERIPAPWRWGASGAALVVAVFLVWFFLFRAPSGGVTPIAAPPPRPALGQTLTYGQYAAAVSSALSDVQAARAVSGNGQANKLKSAAATLEKVEGANVAAPGGGVSEIDNTAVIAALRDSDPNPAAIESGLTTLLESLRAGEQPGAGQLVAGTTSGEDALNRLRGVLSDPAFNYERGLSPLQRLARWLSRLTGEADPGDTLWRVFAALVAALSASSITYLASERLPNRWARLGLSAVVGLVAGVAFFVALGDLGVTAQVLGAVGLVVAAIAVALLVSGVGRSSAPARPRTVSELAATLGMSASEARRRAGEAAAEGDYRRALRFRCLAVLLALDEAGKLTFDRTATNSEYLYRATGSLHDDLQPLLSRFDAVWYGEAGTSPEDYANYDARAAAIEARVAAERAAEGAGGARLRRSAA